MRCHWCRAAAVSIAPAWQARCDECGAAGPVAASREAATVAWSRVASIEDGHDKGRLAGLREATSVCKRAGFAAATQRLKEHAAQVREELSW